MSALTNCYKTLAAQGPQEVGTVAWFPTWVKRKVDKNQRETADNPQKIFDSKVPTLRTLQRAYPGLIARP